jgi:hypothetical protein
MPQLRSLIAACALLVSLGSAQGKIFDVSGTFEYGFPRMFYGTLTIDTTAGKITGVNIIFPGIEHITRLLGAGPAPSNAAHPP